MDDLDKNFLIWGMFLSSTLNAAVHLRKNYLENLHSTKNQEEGTIKELFDASQRLIKGQNEIPGVGQSSPKIQLSTAKVCVFSDSVVCLGNMHPKSASKWRMGKQA